MLLVEAFSAVATVGALVWLGANEKNDSTPSATQVDRPVLG